MMEYLLVVVSLFLIIVVKVQHQLTYATVVGLGAVTLAILSAFHKR